MFLHSQAIPTGAIRLILVTLCLCASVEISPAQAPPTFEELLQQHHIETTEPSLLRALHSPEKEVRGLAAAELAELKMTNALPEIVYAAQIEIDAQTQVNIAAAATWMGSDQGLKILTSICRNRTISAYIRVSAAQDAFDRQDHSCFSSLVELMRPDAEPDERISALSAASQFKSKTQEETQLVLDSALLALRDENIRLRLQASEALRWINDPRSLQPLRKAINDEHEDSIRQQMQSAMNFIEHQHPNHPEPTPP